MGVEPSNSALGQTAQPQSAQPAPPSDASRLADRASTEQRIASALNALDAAAAESGHTAHPQTSSPFEGKLVEARLGIAAGLFRALQLKHPPTASHSLRVALGCSSWALATELDSTQRDALELAALLHDVGKVVVPDNILTKPGRLTPEEQNWMSLHREAGEQILLSSGASADILRIYHGCRVRFEQTLNNAHITLCKTAKMLSIVDAFDSMTTDHVYRAARTREQALAELFGYAGTQFDPQLVTEFASLFEQNQNLLTAKVASRWLGELDTDGNYFPWEIRPAAGASSGGTDDPIDHTSALFEQKLINNMYDGVVFVDNQLNIFQWNSGAERLIGVSPKAAVGQRFTPTLLTMLDRGERFIADEDCPVAESLKSGSQSICRVRVLSRNGNYIDIDLHAIPVRDDQGTILGATLLLHDASSEASLEERCQELHQQATKDPLTQVANRAEFDRALVQYVAAHEQSNSPCSLIMCDIDHFKKVNDTYGHQAGDEAIIAFANLLKDNCRVGDLVARYGGEEFALLCAGCNNTTASRRAELLRRQLAQTQFRFLQNSNITASFGVSQLQHGDTPESLLRRADRALMQAKEQGRDQVVQLGTESEEKASKKSWWPFASFGSSSVIETELITLVPIELVVRKLRGFISDHDAKILDTDDKQISLELDDRRAANDNSGNLGRSQVFHLNLNFREERNDPSANPKPSNEAYVRTIVEVSIKPRRDRERRREHVAQRARLVLASLRSYLVAREVNQDPENVESPDIISP